MDVWELLVMINGHIVLNVCLVRLMVPMGNVNDILWYHLRVGPICMVHIVIAGHGLMG